jgi:hypothetical protein
VHGDQIGQRHWRNSTVQLSSNCWRWNYHSWFAFARQPSSWTARHGARRRRDWLHGQAGVVAGDRGGGSVPAPVEVATGVQRYEKAKEEEGRGKHAESARGEVALSRRRRGCVAKVPAARSAEVGSLLGEAGVSSDAPLYLQRC